MAVPRLQLAQGVSKGVTLYGSGRLFDELLTGRIKCASYSACTWMDFNCQKLFRSCIAMQDPWASVRPVALYSWECMAV